MLRPFTAAALVCISLVSFVQVVVADAVTLPVYGYGSYPCTQQVDGVLLPDQSICDAVSSGFQCVKQTSSSYYFCGISGADCRAGICDGGECVDGKCVGGLGDTITFTGRCMSVLGAGSDGICGGEFSQCAYPVRQYEGQPVNDQYDQLCLSNFCSRASGLAQCRNFVTKEGGDCTFDPERACANGLVPKVNTETFECTCEKPPPPPSQRARQRARRKLDTRCPTSYTACSLADGYECIDILTNLEQCGGCNADVGGMDCTTLRGVAGVGCVNGRCEIWACDDEYLFVPESGTCVPKT